MPWRVVLGVVVGVVWLAGHAAATVYVPGHIRDGIYIRPHFVAAPERAYEQKLPAPVQGPGDRALSPDPMIIDQAVPSKKLPERSS